MVHSTVSGVWQLGVYSQCNRLWQPNCLLWRTSHAAGCKQVGRFPSVGEMLLSRRRFTSLA